MQPQSGEKQVMIWPAKAVMDMLHAQCETLVDSIVAQARDQGYTDQTSSMRAAWTEAAESIHLCLVAYLSDPLRLDAVDGRHDYGSDIRFARLRESAQRHHDAGVPLAMHNGLIKLYRQVYIKHFSCWDAMGGENWKELPESGRFIACLGDFFDKVELASLSPWSVNAPRDAVLSDSLRRLLRERDQYFAALESLRDPVFILGADGLLVTANQAALDTFLSLTEAGALAYRLALQRRKAELQVIVDEVLATDGNEWVAIWMQTRQGRRCFDIRVRALEDAVDKLEPWRLILMHDVTEHYQAMQQARDAEQAMSLFLATMAHEIRSPLHSVLGAAGLMQDAAPGDVVKLVGLLDASARALSATLDNVLSFSRFRHQAPQPCPAPIALSGALQDLVRVKDILARQQGVPLRLEVRGTVPATVLLDWSMTQQILGNLLQNALRHDDGRGVTLGFRCDGDRLVFRVADHGPGLDADILDMLKAPLVVLKPRATGLNGTGLGLGIAQRMTQAMGGSLNVLDSMEGAVLEVSLPLHALDNEEAGVLSDSVSHDHFELSCLLLDDDPISRQVTVAMLERMGLSVDQAHTLEQACALCQLDASAYDVFIVDGRLPDGNGPDFVRYLRRQPALSQAPAFLLSANVEWIRTSSADAALFTAMLEKPLDALSLAQALRHGVVHMTTAPTGHMLDGLTPEVTARMAASLVRQWTELEGLLSAVDPCEVDVELLGRVHRLRSGAMIFGLRDLAAALLAYERVYGEASNAAARSAAYSDLCACQLPAGWQKPDGALT